MYLFRNQYGVTLPFALILTFIFSALVGVSYLFVSVNLNQMQNTLWGIQAIALAEGINEKIKARLNTKTKIQISPEQEEKLQADQETEDEELLEEEEDDEDLLAEDEFDEETEEFDEYYADEILKISRYITFREPPETEKQTELVEGSEVSEQEDTSTKPEANVEMIGSIDIPEGTVFNKGTMIVVYKGEKIDLRLKDISPAGASGFLAKLPVPKIKALTPNYAEANKRASFVVNGENLPKKDPYFSSKDIYIENVKSGPTVYFLTNKEIMPGLTRFYWDSAQAEFYIIPAYDGSIKPVINEVKAGDDIQLFEVKAGARLSVMIYGYNLYLNKSQPVVLPDVVGIIPQLKDQASGGKELTISLSIARSIEPGIHSLVVATEGGLSNTWLFNILPPDEQELDRSANTAIYTSSLTLLDINAIESVLPLIDEEEAQNMPDKSSKSTKKSKKIEDDISDEPEEEFEPTEKQKLSPFANTDLETLWLLETSVMVGKVTKTVSEVIHRQIPNIHASLITNGSVTFNGGNFQILGVSTAMTTLLEPTYVSNTVLTVEGPQEEPEVPLDLPNTVSDGGRAEEAMFVPKSPSELGFSPNSFLAVYKEGDRISDLDYSVINKVGRNTIELVPPGLMDFHYQNDQITQFIPPLISSEMISGEEAEKHIVPKDFAINQTHAANSKDIFGASLSQLSELADLFTNDTIVPKDEFDLPAAYMGLTYIDGVPAYDKSNPLNGKGILIIDTSSNNQGKPLGDVQISGDSKTPIEWRGIIYVYGNLTIGGNVNINGALIVDNTSAGQIEVTSDALGRIAYDDRIIKQTLLYLPFTTIPGTVMISNKSIDLSDYVQSGEPLAKGLGAAPAEGQQESAVQGLPQTPAGTQVLPEEAIVETETTTKGIETIQIQPGSSKPAEEELIDLF